MADASPGGWVTRGMPPHQLPKSSRKNTVGGGGRSGRGFTLIEMMLGAAILVIAFVALLGAFLSQSILNAHARSLTTAINDATRVMEEMRAQNTGLQCGTAPRATVPVPTGQGTCTGNLTSWNDWLQLCGGGKSLPNPTREELIVVTCQDENGGWSPGDYCGSLSPAQVSAGEWTFQAQATSFDPIRITVAVCWRQRGRVIGECTWNGTTLTTLDGSNGPNNQQGVIESPAMLTTLMTCRSGS